MNGFILCGDGSSGHTLVPDVFLDNYMPGANGEYVKIYLFLLRCLKSDAQELSIPLIADRFDHTESDVRRALKYWEKMCLLKLEYDDAKNLTGIRMLNGAAGRPDAASEKAESAVPKERAAQTERVASAPAKAPAKRKQTELLTPDAAKQLLFICEQYLGRTLSSQEVARLLDLHDSLGFSADLIEYLVEYCVSGGHRSIHYIEATARGWHDSGCTTVAQARQQATTYNRAYFKILKAFGISGRNPVDVEIAYMNKWMKEYGFSLELITEACSRTMAAIHQPGFAYADKILSDWKKNGVTALPDLSALDQSRQAEREKEKEQKQAAPARKASASGNRFHNFKERDYDYKELEKLLINR